MAKQEELERQIQYAITAMAKIPHKILVMSGKGGVGKTTVAVNMAYAYAAGGTRVGIVDTDLHGPNVALMTGIEGRQVHGKEGLMEPVTATLGVQVLSIASFLPGPDSPVIWRGPKKFTAIRQFLSEGDWRKTDLLIVDCPPGTGDEPMAVAQLIPDADGVVIVTSPQDVALLDSRKCVNFVREINHKVLGIVENLSGYVCPACGHEENLFKMGGGEKAAGEMKVPFLGRIPVTPAMVEAGDSGRPLVDRAPEDPASKAVFAIAEAIQKTWEAPEKVPDKQSTADEADGKGGKEPPSGRLIAVAADDERGLDGTVSQHFGRCPYYVLAEVEGDVVQGIRIERNPFFENHQPGRIPQFVHSLGAQTIIAGAMGPKAIGMFEQLGIDVATGVSGRVGNAVDGYLTGAVSGIVPCNHDHEDSCHSH